MEGVAGGGDGKWRWWYDLKVSNSWMWWQIMWQAEVVADHVAWRFVITAWCSVVSSRYSTAYCSIAWSASFAGIPSTCIHLMVNGNLLPVSSVESRSALRK